MKYKKFIFILLNAIIFFSIFNSDLLLAFQNFSDSKVLYVGGSGPGNYSSIQIAINNADDGDIVYVYNGTYSEIILIDKPIKLIGENKDITFINAEKKGDAVLINADNVHLSNFTLCNTGIGVDYFYNSALKVQSDNNVITNLSCINTNFGMCFINSNGNFICDNYIKGYWDGISFDYSENNTLRNNSMYGSGLLTDQKQDIDTSNTINNKIIYYYYNETGLKVPEDSGQVILIKCNNFTVENLTINGTTLGISIFNSDNNIIKNNVIYENTDFGIILNNSDNNTIYNNNVYGNIFGIALAAGGLRCYESFSNCENNTISKNNISNNSLGLMIIKTNNNKIIENNFIENKIHVEIVMSFKNKFNKNYWDNWLGLKLQFFENLPKFIPILFTYKRIFSNLPIDVRKIPVGFIFDENPSESPYDL